MLLFFAGFLAGITCTVVVLLLLIAQAAELEDEVLYRNSGSGGPPAP